MHKNEKKIAQILGIFYGKSVKILTLTLKITAETTYSAIWPKYWSVK